MFKTLCVAVLVACVTLQLSVSAASFDHNAAAEWAESCAFGCSECPDDNSCGCTYFTTHALVHGGWSGGYEGTCATLWSNFKAGKYAGWQSVGTDEAAVQEGFAVIMNNGHDGDASHCCVGTGKGKVSCHNPGKKDVAPSTTWYAGGGINAIWGWSSDIKSGPAASSEQKEVAVDAAVKIAKEGVLSAVAMNVTAQAQPLGDSVISCGAYEADKCNCVYYARDRQPALPGGCTTCADKENMANSHTAKAGCVLFRTGDPTYCHAAYVTKVSSGTVHYEQSNWTPCACSSDSLPEDSNKIIGYYCP